MSYIDPEWPLGSRVPSHFDAGIVAASFFASLCGCFLTVELLNRRGTALGNLRSWLETLGCAISMGLVGIWAMHFIGNRAIILGNGSTHIQLVYNPGFTTLSVFLPIIGLTIAFSAAEIATRSAFLHWSLLLCTCIFAGLSIVGMHYIGNFGISNYRLDYAARDFAASIIIAIGDCMCVLMLFYTWREKWISAWWKRLACALLLAGGVTAMHFTASTNCMYTLTAYSDESDIRARNIQVLVAGVLCGTAAALSFAVLLIIKHRSGILKSRSQKVMLACAIFDPDGKIMVTTEGVLPAQEITDRYHHHTFDEDFDAAHPVFQWIYRVTHHWSSVSGLIPSMRDHLNAMADGKRVDSRLASSRSNHDFDELAPCEYSIVFRERFCVAAASLAATMHVSLDKVGTLYNNIIDTGTLPPDRRAKLSRRDLEANSKYTRRFGKGQLLFLMQTLTNDDVDHFLNTGFRFASIGHVGKNVAEPMRIPVSTLKQHITQIRRHLGTSESTVAAGTWLSCFVMVPKPGHKGFDVVVQGKEQDRLPNVPLLLSEPLPWQVDFLQRMDGMKTSTCMEFLQHSENNLKLVRSTSEHQFAASVAAAINHLAIQIPAAWFQKARFCAQPMRLSCSTQSETSNPLKTIFAFCLIADVHTTYRESKQVTRIPLNLFRTMEYCTKGRSSHRALERSIRQEFGPMLSQKVAAGPSRTATERWRMRIAPLHPGNSYSPRSERSDSREKDERAPTKSERKGAWNDSANHTPISSPDCGLSSQTWRSSNARSETLVKAYSTTQSESTLPQAGPETVSGVTDDMSCGEHTYVDSLIAITRARFLTSRAAP